MREEEEGRLITNQSRMPRLLRLKNKNANCIDETYSHRSSTSKFTCDCAALLHAHQLSNWCHLAVTLFTTSQYTYVTQLSEHTQVLMGENSVLRDRKNRLSVDVDILERMLKEMSPQSCIRKKVGERLPGQ